MSFAPRNTTDPKSEIVREVRGVLEEMFTETGMETILYYLKIDYGTDLNSAWKDPIKFQESILEFLGDFGGKLILRRMVGRVFRLSLQSMPAPQDALNLEVAVARFLSPNLPAR